ncbi:hypothetical protein CCMA1212_000484 [Trichoderma ghanense]|uniref:Uncharacterized protein n=1 Tax=Trichoderma ghanense TaxID=65468 RepID=A0ABY2HFT5_9HYPO
MSTKRVRACSRIAAQRKASTFVEETPQDAEPAAADASNTPISGIKSRPVFQHPPPFARPLGRSSWPYNRKRAPSLTPQAVI